MDEGGQMSEGIAVSLVCLLLFLILLQMVTLFVLHAHLTETTAGVRALNHQVQAWRKEFGDTFDSVTVMDDDLWGNDQEEEHNGR
jgi:hypothetical protein